MVLGEVVVRVPPQVAEEVVETVKPAGNVSVKETPVAATLLGFDRVKVSEEVPPTAIGFGENDFVMVGGVGTPQPVKTKSSSRSWAVLSCLFAPIFIIRKVVVPVPVATAVVAGKTVHAFLAESTPKGIRLLHAPLSALEKTYKRLS
jgi:hypothetical protein